MMARSDADIAVISAENFERVDPEDLQRALRTHLPRLADSARFIAYVRPHADRLVSTFAERVKAGYFAGTLSELHHNTKATRRFFYYERFSRWQAVFGDRFTLRPMIRSALYHNCVVQDFLNFALSGRPFELIEDPQSNLSLSLEDLAMIRELHLHLRKNKKLGKSRIATGLDLGRILASSPSQMSSQMSGQKGTKLRLPASLVHDVIATYQQDAARLDAKFFAGTPMTAALISAPTRASAEFQSVKAEDHFSRNQLRLIHAWCQLTEQMIKSDPDSIPVILRRQQAADLKHRAGQLRAIQQDLNVFSKDSKNG